MHAPIASLPLSPSAVGAKYECASLCLGETVTLSDGDNFGGGGVGSGAFAASVRVVHACKNSLVAPASISAVYSSSMITMLLQAR